MKKRLHEWSEAFNPRLRQGNGVLSSMEECSFRRRSESGNSNHWLGVYFRLNLIVFSICFRSILGHQMWISSDGVQDAEHVVNVRPKWELPRVILAWCYQSSKPCHLVGQKRQVRGAKPCCLTQNECKLGRDGKHRLRWRWRTRMLVLQLCGGNVGGRVQSDRPRWWISTRPRRSSRHQDEMCAWGWEDAWMRWAW